MGFGSSLYDLPLLLRNMLRNVLRNMLRNMLRNVHRHTEEGCFPLAVLAWETFWKVTLLHPWWHQRKRGNEAKVLMVRDWTSVWDASRSTPGAPLPLFGGRTRRDGSRPPALVREGLNLAREGSLGGMPVPAPI